jgi:hypothetical protein
MKKSTKRTISRIKARAQNILQRVSDRAQRIKIEWSKIEWQRVEFSGVKAFSGVKFSGVKKIGG